MNRELSERTLYLHKIYFMPEKPVRVRFAPSPTGPLHIGSVRTALYNYLYAKKKKGTFILRIEDTDQKRFVKGAEKYIKDSLKWCGIIIDEGVGKWGVNLSKGPYRQSKRLDKYFKYINILVDKGFAYYAFDTPEELDKLRKECEQKGEVFTYDATIRGSLVNSLVLSEQEVQAKIRNKEPYVIRFKILENKILPFKDKIRGKLKVNTSTLDDKILLKSDGMPTYHLANVVDDHLMQITYIIRGEEWLPSLPLHILLYNAFNWELPQFAHMPLTLKPDGKGKLSKRDGDRLGFPVFPLEWKNPETSEKSSGYRESGYFPEAFVNIIAFLGWNPGTTQEIFSMEELIKAFSLERVIKAGSRFDPDKAKWYNHQYLQLKSNNELADGYSDFLTEKGIEIEENYVSKVVELVKERADFISDLWEQSFFFFAPPEQYDEKVVKKQWKEETPDIMNELIEILADIDEFSSSRTESVVKEWITKRDLGMGQVMNVFRLLIVGAPKGPHLFDIIGILGKEETLNRIKTGIKKIEKID